MTYTTERLIIRPTNTGDASFIFKLMNAPKWIQFIGDRKILTEEDAYNYIQVKMEPQYERLGFGNYTVIRKEDMVKMGSCGIYDREGIDGVDIGYAFLPEFEGKGYATESAMKVKEIGIQEFGLKTINGITSKKNTASQKLLEKIGLTFRKYMILPDETEEIMFYQFNLAE